jgi:flagellar hook-associated protein 3 FlgL
MRPVGTTFLLQQRVGQYAIRQNQLELTKAQVELSTQRHNDVLHQLSGHTGRNIRWHAERDVIEYGIQANDLHDVRATVSQTSLNSASKLASDFLANLISARGAAGGRTILQGQAKNALATLSDLLNVDIDGAFLFAGRNQTTPPINNFHGGAGETAFDAAFLTEFGITKTDPSVLNITQSQIETFFNGNFATLFASPAWEANISNSSDENVTAFAGQSQTVDVLANANETPVRQLYSAFVAISEIASGNLNDSSFKKLVDVTAAKVSSAVQGLADMQSRIGVNQKSLEQATSQLKSRKSWLDEVIVKTESVDTYEVATRINGLMSQLEASYSVTSRISRISLLNYL